MLWESATRIDKERMCSQMNTYLQRGITHKVELSATVIVSREVSSLCVLQTTTLNHNNMHACYMYVNSFVIVLSCVQVYV